MVGVAARSVGREEAGTRPPEPEPEREVRAPAVASGQVTTTSCDAPTFRHWWPLLHPASVISQPGDVTSDTIREQQHLEKCKCAEFCCHEWLLSVE